MTNTSMQRLSNKVVVVTGAAEGIGLAISKIFSEHGATVVMADLNLEKVKSESQCINCEGGKSIAIECDVSVQTSVHTLIAHTIAQFNHIDVLVNNAAIALSGNVIDMPTEDWQTVINTNLNSAFYTIQACLPHMLKQQSGSVINMSSVQASRSWHNWTAYAAAKGGLVAMTNQLAGQFGEFGVRFNSISPGAIMTPLNQKRVEQEGEAFLQESINMSPAKRMGTTKEVAMTALLLASDEAQFINGEDIRVDGGLCTVPRYKEGNTQ